MKERDIVVIFSQKRTISSSAKTWGELKRELVEIHGYYEHIRGQNMETGKVYEKGDEELPEGSFTLVLVKLTTKYGA